VKNSEFSPSPLPCGVLNLTPQGKPFPSRGEGKHIEIQEEIPSPSRGEGQGGGGNGVFSHLPSPEGREFFLDSGKKTLRRNDVRI
jgi:hypothetical protein